MSQVDLSSRYKEVINIFLDMFIFLCIRIYGYNSVQFSYYLVFGAHTLSTSIMVIKLFSNKI